jgi:hypothetical protein
MMLDININQKVMVCLFLRGIVCEMVERYKCSEIHLSVIYNNEADPNTGGKSDGKNKQWAHCP